MPRRISFRLAVAVCIVVGVVSYYYGTSSLSSASAFKPKQVVEQQD